MNVTESANLALRCSDSATYRGSRVIKHRVAFLFLSLSRELYLDSKCLLSNLVHHSLGVRTQSWCRAGIAKVEGRRRGTMSFTRMHLLERWFDTAHCSWSTGYHWRGNGIVGGGLSSIVWSFTTFCEA
jgi:hypothetical protein